MENIGYSGKNYNRLSRKSLLFHLRYYENLYVEVSLKRVKGYIRLFFSITWKECEHSFRIAQDKAVQTEMLAFPPVPPLSYTKMCGVHLVMLIEGANPYIFAKTLCLLNVKFL